MKRLEGIINEIQTTISKINSQHNISDIERARAELKNLYTQLNQHDEKDPQNNLNYMVLKLNCIFNMFDSSRVLLIIKQTFDSYKKEDIQKWLAEAKSLLEQLMAGCNEHKNEILKKEYYIFYLKYRTQEAILSICQYIPHKKTRLNPEKIKFVTSFCDHFIELNKFILSLPESLINSEALKTTIIHCLDTLIKTQLKNNDTPFEEISIRIAKHGTEELTKQWDTLIESLQEVSGKINYTIPTFVRIRDSAENNPKKRKQTSQQTISPSKLIKLNSDSDKFPRSSLSRLNSSTLFPPPSLPGSPPKPPIFPSARPLNPSSPKNSLRSKSSSSSSSSSALAPINTHISKKNHPELKLSASLTMLSQKALKLEEQKQILQSLKEKQEIEIKDLKKDASFREQEHEKSAQKLKEALENAHTRSMQLEENTKTLTQEATNLNSEIKGLQEKTLNLQDSLAKSESEKAELRQQIEIFQKRTREADEKFLTQEKTISNLQIQLESQQRILVESHEKSQKMELDLAGDNDSAKVQELEQEISDLQVQFNLEANRCIRIFQLYKTEQQSNRQLRETFNAAPTQQCPQSSNNFSFLPSSSRSQPRQYNKRFTDSQAYEYRKFSKK